jgi:hypothetical protein
LLAENRDLVIIQKNGTGSGKTEVHILTAVSQYREFSLQTPTILQETDQAFQFGIAANRDVFAIQKYGTGSGKTEVHILAASSRYQQYSLQVPTAMHPTDQTVEFEVGPNRNIYAVMKSGTRSGTTEVHVLTASSGYAGYGIQVPTALHETDQTFEFEVLGNGDLYAISKTGPGSGTTEIHVLSAASRYREFSLQTRTRLPPTDDNFTFALAANRDVFAMQLNATASNMTEVHVLRR